MPVLSNGTQIRFRAPDAPRRFRAPSPTADRIVVVRGPAGATGPAGSGNSDAIEYVQSAPSASWIIPTPEAMGRTPSVAVYVGGQLVMTDVFANETNVNVVFSEPTTGSAVLT